MTQMFTFLVGPSASTSLTLIMKCYKMTLFVWLGLIRDMYYVKKHLYCIKLIVQGTRQNVLNFSKSKQTKLTYVVNFL